METKNRTLHQITLTPSDYFSSINDVVVTTWANPANWFHYHRIIQYWNHTHYLLPWRIGSDHNDDNKNNNNYNSVYVYCLNELPYHQCISNTVITPVTFILVAWSKSIIYKVSVCSMHILILEQRAYIDGLMQENVTPMLMHWSYVFLALTPLISCEQIFLQFYLHWKLYSFIIFMYLIFIRL